MEKVNGVLEKLKSHCSSEKHHKEPEQAQHRELKTQNAINSWQLEL